MLYCKYFGIMCNFVDSTCGTCVAPKCIHEEALRRINENVDDNYWYNEEKENE